jgi:hypothetical protein
MLYLRITRLSRGRPDVGGNARVLIKNKTLDFCSLKASPARRGAPERPGLSAFL